MTHNYISAIQLGGGFAEWRLMTILPFADRYDAGRKLANSLLKFHDASPIVLGIARGGVPVAAEVANKLNAPLDALIVRKVGAPGNPEYGIGAVAETGTYWIDHHVASALGLSPEEVETEITQEQAEIQRLVHAIRNDRQLIDVKNKTVILVDDGLATGGTAHAAILALRKLGAKKIILGVPVGASGAVSALRALADEVVCPEQPKEFDAVSLWYIDFSPVNDSITSGLISGATTTPRAISLYGLPGEMTGELTIPNNPLGTVIFAHGMGSGRMSPRNRHVASALNAGGIATLLIDLLIGDEINRPELSENIDFLASRLLQATHFIETHRQLHGLPLGYFGASLGAAVALTAAALRPRYIHSIVCRGGRVDLAANAISKITADCLLIVGSKDYEILQINERALPSFTSRCNLDIVLGADHLFEEPGALDELSTKTMRWFLSSFMPAATYTKHAA